MEFVERRQTVLFGQCSHVDTVPLYPRIAYSLDPFRLQDVYLRPSSCDMLVLCGVDSSDQKVCYGRGQVQAMRRAHLNTDITESILEVA